MTRTFQRNGKTYSDDRDEQPAVSAKTNCIHLGEHHNDEACTCGSSSKVAIHRCAIHRICCPKSDAAKIKGWEGATLPKNCGGCADFTAKPRAFAETKTPARFISTEDRIKATHALSAILPDSVAGFIGVARSGLTIALELGMLRHRPVKSLNQKTGVVSELGHGSRLSDRQQHGGEWIVIDDTCMTGYSLQEIRKHLPNAKVAVLYWNPNQERGNPPDFYAEKLEWPHLLEWNLFNSILVRHMATDMDGVLCHDCPAPYDDDAKHYANFLETVKPLYHVQRKPIPLIVTARLEKYRPQTEAWLRRHGVQFERLEMFPHESRKGYRIGEWKGGIYREWAETHYANPGPHIFVESSDTQARDIAKVSGRIVVCTDSKRCYQ